MFADTKSGIDASPHRGIYTSIATYVHMRTDAGSVPDEEVQPVLAARAVEKASGDRRRVAGKARRRIADSAGYRHAYRTAGPGEPSNQASSRQGTGPTSCQVGGGSPGSHSRRFAGLSSGAGGILMTSPALLDLSQASANAMLTARTSKVISGFIRGHALDQRSQV